MLRSDKILQKKTVHYMEWWSSMPDVEFYRLHNGLWARGLMPCLCRVFAVIYAIFTKVCRVFHHFLPWFSNIPMNDHCTFRTTSCLCMVEVTTCDPIWQVASRSSLCTHLRATGRHLPYGITCCYLQPPTQVNMPQLTRTRKTGTRGLIDRVDQET